MECPVHKLLLDYNTEAHGYKCPFCKGIYHSDHDVAVNDTYNIAPSPVEDLFSQIRFSVLKSYDKVTVKASLPPGFSMREFTRIYHLRDAEDFGISEEQYIEHQKKEMLKDLLQRIKTERAGLL